MTSRAFFATYYRLSVTSRGLDNFSMFDKVNQKSFYTSLYYCTYDKSDTNPKKRYFPVDLDCSLCHTLIAKS